MRLSATSWLEHLDASRTLALAGEAEGVHQVRVALRRLRVWLGFSKRTRELERELRWLCRALAPLRDLDVFGEVFTAQAREALRPEVVARAVDALQSKRFHALRAELEQVKAPRRRRAKQAVKRLEAAVEKRRGADGGEALHALRRELRRLRYAREWLGEDASALAREQEQLGAVCDLLALERFVRSLDVEVPEALVEGVARGLALSPALSPARRGRRR